MLFVFSPHDVFALARRRGGVMGCIRCIATALLFIILSCSQAHCADVLRIGALPAADSLILYAAVEDGAFSSRGLDVRVVPFQSALELGAAMRAGALDGHFGDIINVLMQNESGARQAIIATTSHSAPGARHFGLAVSPACKAQSLAELKGKTCSIGRATIVEFVLDMLLEKGGAAGTLEKVDIRQIPARLQMLLSGRIDSALLPEPLLSLAEERGAHTVMDDGVLDIPLAVIALRVPEGGMDDSFADRADRFRAALAEEAERINASPEAYKEMMKKLKLIAPQAMARYAMMRFRVGVTPLGLPTAEDVNAYAEWMQRFSILKKGCPSIGDIAYQAKP